MEELWRCHLVYQRAFDKLLCGSLLTKALVAEYHEIGDHLHGARWFIRRRFKAKADNEAKRGLMQSMAEANLCCRKR